MVTSNARTLWNIPYQRNPFFTGREDVLNQLHRALRAEHKVALSQPQGITGLGGIGKTQTVLEYAYRHRSAYDAVFWVRAESSTLLTSSLVELAHVLELPERNEHDQEMIVQAVLRWFRHHHNWLLIYDNIDDLAVAEPFLPKAGSGHLLFTTRAHALGGLAQRLDIQKMDADSGALLLLRRASLLATAARLDMAHPNERHMAQTISQELDGLPLALDQAGAYIKEAPCPLSDYLERYQTRHSNILQERGSFNQDYPASVTTTWSLSFEKISQANPAATELLNFCAFLAPDAIPESILISGAPHLGAVLAPVVVNPIQLDQVCQEVLRFSLFQRGVNEQTLTVHRLVQAVLRDSMPVERQQQWMQRVVYAVEATYPESLDVANWPVLESLLPHALTSAVWIEQAHFAIPQASRLLDKAGHYLYHRGRYGEAEPLFKQELAICEQELGANDPDTGGSLNNLGNLYRAQGSYEEAEPLLQRALAIYKQTLRPSHPNMATSLNNLALLQSDQGKYREAESLYQQALVIYEQEWGPSHPNTANSLNNLANLYVTQGSYGKAEPLFQRALEIREQELGFNHPDTANSLISLAELYRAQGKYGEAEPLHLRTLAICEQVLGPSHPHTASSLNTLAGLYRVQGRYGEAEPLYLRALAIREQELGPSHPDTAVSLNNLAVLYSTQGRYEEAEPLYLRALAIREQVLGPSHPRTAICLDNLAGFYVARKRYGEAEPLFKRALAICEQKLGPSHPHTANSLKTLAELYVVQGRYGEAEPLFKRALEVCEQKLGPSHPDTALSLNSLANLYRAQGKSSETEVLYQRALAISKRVLGRAHPSTQTMHKNYVSLLRTMGREADAKRLEAEP